MRCCGDCECCLQKDVYDEDGEPSDEDMGLCVAFDAIVHLGAPACDYLEGGR